MAFLSKAGNILRHAASKHANSEIFGSNPSVFQMIRCMSTSKVFVGGLSYATDDMSLREAFNKYGEVVEARIIIDRETGRSRGFGFVTYTSGEEASAAIQALDGQDLHGRRVKVNYANERPPRSGGFGAGGYGAGGYGSGSYGGGGGYGGGAGGYGGADNYGGGSNYGSYGGGGGYRGNNYGTGGSGDGFGVGNYAQGGTYSSGNANDGGSSGNYGSGSQSCGVAEGNSYGSGGSRDSYGGGNFASGGTYPSGSNYVSGSSGNYGSGSQSFNVAGVGGGSDSYVRGDAGANRSFASGGIDGSTGFGHGGDQFGVNESSDAANTSGGLGQDDPIEGDYRDDVDDDEQPDDYANRKA